MSLSMPRGGHMFMKALQSQPSDLRSFRIPREWSCSALMRRAWLDALFCCILAVTTVMNFIAFSSVNIMERQGQDKQYFYTQTRGPSSQRVVDDSNVTRPHSPAKENAIVRGSSRAEDDEQEQFLKELSNTFSLPGQTPVAHLPAVAYAWTSSSGMGSQLLNMYAAAIYLQESQSRTLIVDESTAPYRMNSTTGVLRGYFSPGFPVIETPQQYSYIQEYFPIDEFEYNPSHWEETVPEAGGSSDLPMMIALLWSYRTQGLLTINYQKMVTAMCPHMQFNEHAKQKMHNFRKSRGVHADFDKSPSSVAFHVRRGDKVRNEESKRYDGDVYVQKLLQVTANATSFQDCFVATDSYDAVEEIRVALKRRNFSCELWTLTLPSQNEVWENGFLGDNHDLATLEFMSQLDMMIRATYFVGTFNSNVGEMVAILRGCNKPLHRWALTHYFNSYGVDLDWWYLR